MAVGAFPPHPSVEHLVTIFRRIDGRNLLIPAFQRTFVWDQAQILALLESVYNGFPIGSILLWRVDEAVLKISDSPDVPFPKGPPSFPANFVLDGLQRLSTLYGVFHYGAATKSRNFKVGFHLRDQQLFYEDDAPEPRDEYVPLNALFNPRALLSVQQQLLNKPKGDTLVQAALTLQARFQEYMIPLVTLTHREPAEVVLIFERVNSTGTPLSRVDFMSAITWSEDFDLNDALDDIGDDLKDLNFELSDNTIVKALGLTFDLDPLPDVMLRLRDKTSTQLKKAVKKTKSTFMAVVAFLRDEVKVFGSDFVPYEGQLLVIFNIFNKYDQLNDRQKAALKAWYFAVSFSEALQGKPDNYIARMIRNVASSLAKGSLEVQRPAFSFFDLLDRRMIRGKALSTAFVSLLGEAGAKSLITGREIPIAEYLSVYDNSHFWPIYTKDEIPRGGDSHVSAKIIPNVVLVTPSDAPEIRKAGIKNVITGLYRRKDHAARSILKSQLLPTGTPTSIGRDPMRLLVERTEMIAIAVNELIKPALRRS